MEDSLSIIEEEMEQLEVSTGESEDSDDIVDNGEDVILMVKMVTMM